MLRNCLACFSTYVDIKEDMCNNPFALYTNVTINRNIELRLNFIVQLNITETKERVVN